jgi:hypothetical protein
VHKRAPQESQQLTVMLAVACQPKGIAEPECCGALTLQVYSVDVGGDGVCALAFHPYHPLICAADTRGFIRVSGCSACSWPWHMASA